MSTSSPMSPTSPTLNIGGLASGLDTNSIIQQLMAIESQPLTQLKLQQSLAQAKQTLLQGFQTQLQSVSTAVQSLRSVMLFAQTQSADSSDPTKLTAATTNGIGAAVGSYQVDVAQLANASQRTFAFTSPTSNTTITIDGHDTAVGVGASAQDLATAINTDPNATVYAAATDANTLVFSNRLTGDLGSNFIQVTDTSGTLTEDTTLAKQGRDALYRLDGAVDGSGNPLYASSHSNTVTGAVPGITLTLKSLTTTSGPVTVSIGAPGADVGSIQKALQSFVSVYNSTLDAIQAKLTEKSVQNPTTTADQQKGLLYGDQLLSGLLDQMRQAIYTAIPGLPNGMQSLADLGISTGAPSNAVNQDAIAGHLTLDTDKLTQAVTTNPNGVRNLLMGGLVSGTTVTGFSQKFQSIVDAAASSGGMLDTGIQSAGATIKTLQNQIDNMNQRLTLRQQTLQAQFTALETALTQSQSQQAWLTSQIAALG